MNLNRALVIVFTSLSITTAHADTRSLEVSIGGDRFELNSPDGFHEISGLSPDLRSIMETVTPPINRLLGVFVSERDLGRILNNDDLEFDRYMLLQTNRQLENRKISENDFKQIASIIRDQQNTLLEDYREKIDSLASEASRDLSENLDLSIDLKIGQQYPLGVFHDTPGVISLAHIGKYRMQIQGQGQEYVMVFSTTLMVVNQRLLYLYVYSEFEDQSDIDWVRSTTIAWIDSIDR